MNVETHSLHGYILTNNEYFYQKEMKYETFRK